MPDNRSFFYLLNRRLLVSLSEHTRGDVAENTASVHSVLISSEGVQLLPHGQTCPLLAGSVEHSIPAPKDNRLGILVHAAAGSQSHTPLRS